MRIKHPEARDCEIFLGNVSKAHFERLKWTTKRLGEKAIDQVEGLPIPAEWGFHPVFVQDFEVELCNHTNL